MNIFPIKPTHTSLPQTSEVLQTSEVSATSEVSPPQSRNSKKKWLKLIEFAVVGFATWLDPSAGLLLFLLKLCFQLLHTLQDDNSH